MGNIFVEFIKIKPEKVKMDIIGMTNNNTSFLKCSIPVSLPKETIELKLYAFPKDGNIVDIHISPFDVMQHDFTYGTNELENIIRKMDSIIKTERKGFYYKDINKADFIKILEMEV